MVQIAHERLYEACPELPSGPKATISADWWQLLLEGALLLLKVCMVSSFLAPGKKKLSITEFAERVVKAGRERSLLARLRARRVLQAHLLETYGPGGWASQHGDLMVEAIFTAAGKARAEEVAALVHEALPT